MEKDGEKEREPSAPEPALPLMEDPRPQVYFLIISPSETLGSFRISLALQIEVPGPRGGDSCWPVAQGRLPCLGATAEDAAPWPYPWGVFTVTG